MIVLLQSLNNWYYDRDYGRKAPPYLMKSMMYTLIAALEIDKHTINC